LRRIAVLGALVVMLAGCGGSNSVAHVGGTTITRDDLDVAVDHFRQEASAEGRPFPKDGTAAFRTVERQALGLLVYRAELLQSTGKLGVPVTEAEVTARMAGSGGESEGSEAFARDTVRAQIAYEHLYSKVTARSRPARRGAAMQRWLDRMKREYDVSYEAGFGPAS
jgi:SurA-like N-terminal domain